MISYAISGVKLQTRKRNILRSNLIKCVFTLGDHYVVELKEVGFYTKSLYHCYMVFYITMINFLLTRLMNKFTILL
jgi:hypothetical protein